MAERIIGVEGDEEMVACPECDGDEGWHDENGWHNCAECDGMGYYLRKRVDPPQGDKP